MEVRKSHIKSVPFGGILPVLKKLKRYGIPQLINKCLGSRKPQAKYDNKDIVLGWLVNSFCGGIRLDNIRETRKKLSSIPGLNLPSRDTLGRVMKKLATDITIKETVVGKDVKEIYYHEYNEHTVLNEMLVKGTKRLGCLREGVSYTLDMDVTIIPTECYSAKMTYKKTRGFAPMVSSIGKLPVYVSMRNGNVAPAAETKECVERTLQILRKNKIKVGRITMDAASYNGKLFEYINKENIKFYVPAILQRPVKNKILSNTEWTPLNFETANFFWECDAASLSYALYGGDREYRMIVLRTSLNKKSRPAKWSEIGEYAYKILMTNDYDSTIGEIVQIYNQRGTREQNFDALKNDFGWRLPPFSNMNENTVFLLITAFTNNIYQGLLKEFTKQISQLELSMRLKRFVKVFIHVFCSLTNEAIIYHDTDIAFEKIL